MRKIKLTELASNPRNPNRMKDDDKARMIKSLRTFGDLSGIIFNRASGMLVGGHQRINVFRDLLKAGGEVEITKEYKKATRTGTVGEGFLEFGGERYVVRVVEWETEMETAALLAANRFGRVGFDDSAMVKDILQELDTGSFNIEITGFDTEAIYFLSDGAPTAGKIVAPADIVAAIAAQNRIRRISVYTVGIGAGFPGSPLDAFLKALAERNLGVYRRIDN